MYRSQQAPPIQGRAQDLLRTLRASLSLLKVAELKTLLEHFRMPKSGNKSDLVVRLMHGIQRDPVLYKPAHCYISRRQLIPIENIQPSSLNHRRVERPSSQLSYGGYVHPARLQQPPVTAASTAQSREAYKIAADYLKALTNKDPFAEQVASILPVTLFKMPSISVQLDVGQKHMALLKQGYVLRLTCLELTNKMKKSSLRHSWPTNAELIVNRSGVPLRQKQVVDGKVKNKKTMERPADITNFVRYGKNSFKLTGQPNLEKGDWPYGVCVGIFRLRDVAEVMAKVETEPAASTTEKIRRMYSGEDDVVTTKLSVSIKCPLTMMRIKTPARGVSCTHIGCFDLENFLSYQRDARNASWRCIVCDGEPLTMNTIVIDAWTKDVLTACEDKDDVENVDVLADGTFKLIRNLKDSGNKRDRDTDDDEYPPESSQKRIKEEPWNSLQFGSRTVDLDSLTPTRSNESRIDYLTAGSSIDQPIEL